MRRSPVVNVVACVLWLALVVAGFAVLWNYQSRAGNSGRAPAQWPKTAAFPLDSTHDTLVMFAHPRCPCTAASVEELNRLMAQCRGKFAAHVLFFKPADLPENWTRSTLWQSAAAIPGVTVQTDPDGAQARLFGAETSGYVLLFNPQGELLFKGGITGSRGHAGDNAGESTVASLLTGQSVTLKATPVYGCSLLGDCQAPPTLTVK